MNFQIILATSVGSLILSASKRVAISEVHHQQADKVSTPLGYRNDKAYEAFVKAERVGRAGLADKSGRVEKP